MYSDFMSWMVKTLAGISINEEKMEYILVETALRGGGVYISSHLVPLHSGIDNYNMLFNCALGNSVPLQEIQEKRKNAACAYVCFTLPEGEVVSIEGVNEVKKLPSVRLFDIENLTIGSQVQKMVNKTQRLGPIIVSAPNKNTIDNNII